jgi:hypothetical protein
MDSKKNDSRRYQQLFLSIIALYLISSFLDVGQIGGLILGSLFTLTILFAIRTFPLSSRFKFILRVIILLVFTSMFLEFIITHEKINQIIDLFSTFIFCLFLSLSIIFLTKKLLLDQEVDRDTLLGGISMYLLIGILWSQIYIIIFKLDNNAFSISLDHHHFQLMYFSFTTLTTLGYGDISPVNRIAMGFTNLEALIGQLYPAIFIARLVSLYNPHKENKE